MPKQDAAALGDIDRSDLVEGKGKDPEGKHAKGNE